MVRLYAYDLVFEADGAEQPEVEILYLTMECAHGSALRATIADVPSILASAC
jgi:hypothetical protein